jgi:hypothetical protein
MRENNSGAIRLLRSDVNVRFLLIGVVVVDMRKKL